MVGISPLETRCSNTEGKERRAFEDLFLVARWRLHLEMWRDRDFGSKPYCDMLRQA